MALSKNESVSDEDQLSAEARDLLASGDLCVLGSDRWDEGSTRSEPAVVVLVNRNLGVCSGSIRSSVDKMLASRAAAY